MGLKQWGAGSCTDQGWQHTLRSKGHTNRSTPRLLTPSWHCRLHLAPQFLPGTPDSRGTGKPACHAARPFVHSPTLARLGKSLSPGEIQRDPQELEWWEMLPASSRICSTWLQPSLSVHYHFGLWFQGGSASASNLMAANCGFPVQYHGAFLQHEHENLPSSPAIVTQCLSSNTAEHNPYLWWMWHTIAVFLRASSILIVFTELLKICHIAFMETLIMPLFLSHQ